MTFAALVHVPASKTFNSNWYFLRFLTAYASSCALELGTNLFIIESLLVIAKLNMFLRAVDGKMNFLCAGQPWRQFVVDAKSLFSKAKKWTCVTPGRILRLPHP